VKSKETPRNCHGTENGERRKPHTKWELGFDPGTE
jgi:hypothetical protein